MAKRLPESDPTVEPVADEVKGEPDLMTALGSSAPAASPDEVAALRREVETLKDMLASSAAAGTVAPPGYKIVRDEVDQEAKSEAESEAIRQEIAKGVTKRTQEVADAKFPDGKNRYRCSLDADKNGHPHLTINAANPTDARARYLDVCGINATEHKVSIAKAS